MCTRQLEGVNTFVEARLRRSNVCICICILGMVVEATSEGRVCLLAANEDNMR